MKPMLFTLAALMLFSNSMCEGFKRSELGLVTGWGSPSGSGVEYAFYPIEPWSVSAGAGFSFSGTRFSLGSKYFFMAEEFASPFAGLSLTSSGGLSSLNVNVNDDKAVYSINSATFLTPRAGWRFKARNINWYVNAGYGIVLSGGGVQYESGSPASNVRDFAKIFSAGGFELSGSMMFKF